MISNICVECDEAITNPICPECLASRMQQVVSEIDTSLAKDIKGFHMDGGAQCLHCSKSMALCAHCFSKDVYEYLQEKNPAAAEEFLGRFDFDLRTSLVEF